MGVKERAMEMGMKAMGKLMADDKRAARVAKAFDAAQKGKKAIDRANAQVLRTLGFASHSDYRSLAKRIIALTKRAREIDAKLATIS